MALAAMRRAHQPHPMLFGDGQPHDATMVRAPASTKARSFMRTTDSSDLPYVCYLPGAAAAQWAHAGPGEVLNDVVRRLMPHSSQELRARVSTVPHFAASNAFDPFKPHFQSDS
eukprot:44649-Eustigmatos_ZCMA.PRE.1